jgi:hypothetical protein
VARRASRRPLGTRDAPRERARQPRARHGGRGGASAPVVGPLPPAPSSAAPRRPPPWASPPGKGVRRSPQPPSQSRMRRYTSPLSRRPRWLVSCATH